MARILIGSFVLVVAYLLARSAQIETWHTQRTEIKRSGALVPRGEDIFEN